jgi:hypothetical protein
LNGCFFGGCVFCLKKWEAIQKHQGIWPFEKHRELPRIKETFSTGWCIEMTPTRFFVSLRNGDISR